MRQRGAGAGGGVRARRAGGAGGVGGRHRGRHRAPPARLQALRGRVLRALLCADRQGIHRIIFKEPSVAKNISILKFYKTHILF